MPNYYAHLEFGRKVLAQLPIPLRRAVEREKSAFELGLYGPDPLFFYHPLINNRVRRIGQEIHWHTVRPVAERLRQAIEGRVPQAAGYAAGFLCHFALDSACHSYVDARTAEGTLTHAAMEAELDRQLMLQVGLNPMQDTPLPPLPLEEPLYAVLSMVYPEVRPRQFKAGYENFCRISRLLTLAGAAHLRRAVDWIAGRCAFCAKLKGSVLSTEPDPACAESSRILLGRMADEIAPTADELASFFAAVEQEMPLGCWYDRDFHGRSVGDEQPEALIPAAAKC